MSSLLVQSEEAVRINILNDITSHQNKYHSHRNRYVVKRRKISKQRTECKVLRQKLKKYKLRKGGEEDQYVLDVSQVFRTSFVIKSPQKRDLSNLEIELQELRPKNYLFKMARRKLKAKSEKSDTILGVIKSPKKVEIDNVSSPPASQTQKKTNAFQLMMDSRNKSIGSNSPGKEKDIDSFDEQEINEKKTLKAKRNLVLQKMAEAKGSLKKKEEEEYQEELIKRKMEKRAQRLKEMITNKNGVTNNEQDGNPKATNKLNKKSRSHDNSLENKPTVTNGVKKPPKTVHLIDIFNGILKESTDVSPDKKPISKEDEEFLKKLSPSIKKKENMLSYFKKIEKDPEPVADNISENNNFPVIKVKFNRKTKNKGKKRKLSLKKDESCEVITHDENKASQTESEVNHISDSECRKRKRKQSTMKELNESCDITSDKQPKLEEGRPKRNVRRPIKYADDLELNSSDDELQIFTPKKKRNMDKKEKTTELRKDDDDVIICEEKSIICEENRKKTYTKKGDSEKQMKPTKLAPIFATKPQLNPEQLEARQKFLYSGVPDQLKKIIAQEKSLNTERSNCFHTVVHVQQKDMKTCNSDVEIVSYSKFDDDCLEQVHVDDSSLFKCFIDLKESHEKISTDVKKNSISVVLQNMKDYYPKFPVYRTYRNLKGISKGEIKDVRVDLENSVEIENSLSETLIDDPEHLNWTDKYKPMSTKSLIGNFDNIKELKRWLETWTESLVRGKNNYGSDSSDFCYSDTDSKDSMKSANNLLILTGPVGSGKTSSVYAVAAELAMKVIEVNASSKRTGKMMLQDLQEATQSHKVNRSNSQKSQEVTEPFVLKTYKKKGRPKKMCNEKPIPIEKEETLSQQTSSQDTGRTRMSLILIDDADIVFEQDDGFSSAISQLVHSSKRPVILVTASLSCPHLQRFLQCGKVIKMRPLSPRMLGTWLDLLCLADSGTCWPGLGAKFLDYFKGDIRKTINNLQFYMTTQESASDEASSQNSNVKSSCEDESSCMSWAESESAESKNLAPKINIENEVWKCFMRQQTSILHIPCPLSLFDVWWSLPQLYNNSETPKDMETSGKKQELFQMNAIANVIDTLSVCDYFSSVAPDTRTNICSQPWYNSESDSVSESENLDCFSSSRQMHNELICHLTTSSILEATKVFGLETNIDVHFPDMAAQRQRDKIVSCHDNLTDILNPSASLDRRALALDYWSSCRSICRIERSKTDVVSKRHNRYCHYLKTMNVSCKNDSLDYLAKSLSSTGTM